MTHSLRRALGASAVVVLSTLAASGCTTAKMSHTARTGVEQLLVSNAVDQALDKSDFQSFSGQNVFVEDKYLDCVDKPYILGTIRHRTLMAGANLVAKAEEADVVLEPRSGSVGTDTKDMFVGMPALQLPGPLPVSIPEIRMFSKTSQYGTAKLGLVAYDAKTKQILGNGGMAVARADDNNWTFLGLGPYQNGSLRREIHRGTSARGRHSQSEMPYTVAFSPREPAGQPAKLRLAGGEGRRGAAPAEAPAKDE